MTARERIERETETAIEEALAHLPGIEDLETRKSDRLDFKEVSVWGLKAALEAAYRAGRRDEEARAERACRRNARRG